MSKRNLMKTKSWLSVISMVLLWQIVPAGSLLAQQRTRVESKKQTKVLPSGEEELQKGIREQQVARILAVLRATADDAKNWTDAAAASKFQAETAEVMWVADSETARGYLIRAWDRASSVEEPKSERSRFRNQSLRTEARREVLLVARKQAPELAKKWLDQMAQEEQASTDRGAFDDRTPRSTVLLQMALQIVQDDPDAAAALLVESLQDGISFGFQQVLIRIQEKNVELSQNVFRSALSRLKTAGMIDPNELLILYAYLYTPGRVVAASTDANSGHIQLAVGRNRPQIVAAAQLNPGLALEFLRLAANLLLNAPLPATTPDPILTARSQFSAINTLMAPISERLPDLAVALQTRTQQISSDARFSTVNQLAPANTPVSLPGETSANYAERRVDLLEEAARNESYSLGRNIAYAKAALATTVENYSRGWELAGKIEEGSLRENVKNWLTYRASLHFLSRNNLEKAYQLAAKNSDPIQRAASLVVGAQRLIKAKETSRASEWLIEARSLIRKVDPDEDSVHIAFGIVTAFGNFDRVMAFEVFSDAVTQMEKTIFGRRDEDRAPSIRRFSGLETPADLTYGTEGFSLRLAIDAFGPEQFEDVLGIVNRITDKELHGLAIMELCRKYLKATQ
ncbi:MAG TPA: hypothetical protein VJ875_13215 [Pyrinomonadaceae bacterium]|nr:hypothetical protein [Pyrinomonadaceae bacterium]